MKRIRVRLSQEFELAPSVDDASGCVVLSQKDQEDAVAYILGALNAHCGRGKVQRVTSNDLPIDKDAVEKEVLLRIPRRPEGFAEAFLKAIGILLRELTSAARSEKGALALDVQFLPQCSPEEAHDADRLILVGRLIRKAA